MPKKITNFELRDAENGRVIREGDNAMLKKEGVYSVANDDGEWKPFYVVDLDAVEEPTEPDPPLDPAPTPDPDPVPTPTPVPQPIPTGADVSNAAELAQAVQSAGTYTLAPGDYGMMPPLAHDVRLVAADRNNKPVFSGMSLSGVNNVTLDALHFKYTYAAGDSEKKTPCQLFNSDDCEIMNCVFEGDFDGNGTGTGRGFKADGCSNFKLIDNEFFRWWKGLSVGNSSNIIVSGNNVHSIRSDGMNFGRIDTGIVAFNYLHDFGGLAGSGDHRDMIQIQRSSQFGCTNLTIRDNYMDQGGGDYTQGIWFGQDKASTSDPAHAHVGLVIDNNIILNSHTNCIAGSYVTSGSIQGNIIAPIPRVANNPGTEIPNITVGGSVTMTGNVAPGIRLNGGLPAGNTETSLDPATERAKAMADPRFVHFFGG